VTRALNLRATAWCSMQEGSPGVCTQQVGARPEQELVHGSEHTGKDGSQRREVIRAKKTDGEREEKEVRLTGS
jgi:hypothetical protein